MDLSTSKLFPTRQQCEKIAAAYPDLKATFGWFEFQRIVFTGKDVERKGELNNRVYDLSKFTIGKNYIQQNHNNCYWVIVDKIVPAFTLQDLIKVCDCRVFQNETAESFAKCLIDRGGL